MQLDILHWLKLTQKGEFGPIWRQFNALVPFFIRGVGSIDNLYVHHDKLIDGVNEEFTINLKQPFPFLILIKGGDHVEVSSNDPLLLTNPRMRPLKRIKERLILIQ